MGTWFLFHRGANSSSNSYIPFSDPRFIPQVGPDTASNFQIISDNQLSITAGSDTDDWDGTYTAPLMKYPAAGDFIAQVRVNFDPLQNVQAAGIGVEQTGQKNTFIRMARSWDTTNNSGSNIIDGANVNGGEVRLRSTKYTSKAVWLKVRRQGSQFSLSYSNDGTSWVTLDSNVAFDFGTNVNVFMYAFSRFNGHPVTAYFDSFQITPL